MRPRANLANSGENAREVIMGTHTPRHAVALGAATFGRRLHRREAARHLYRRTDRGIYHLTKHDDSGTREVEAQR